MEVILVSRRRDEAKTVILRAPQLALIALPVALAVAACGAAFNAAMMRHHSPVPVAQAAPSAAPPAAPASVPPEGELQHIAMQVARMQSQLVRLDRLGDRLARLAGFRSDELAGAADDPSAAIDAVPPAVMTLAGLTRQIDAVFGRLEGRRDALGALDSLFSLDDLRRKLVPSSLPLAHALRSSGFGWRVDPFTGEREFHEGLDLMAERGTAIRAAAAGVVVYSDFHPQYGNMIEIDHGNGITTRYAHAAKRFVRVGEVVDRGTEIGEVGSTGRSTGNHLHFEVRRNGAPLNPAQFLRLRG
jgi:murein DD-endopeptidase MepM/ murein hydrolase activator NlpD